MTLYLKIKTLSKRKPLVDRVPLVIDHSVSRSNKLIEYIVRRNVEDYNKQAVDAPIFPYLSDERLANNIAAGKSGFDDRKNEKQQDPDKAVENALVCFNDGIFKLFINDTETGFDEPLTLKDGDEITFIRLTMLAGRLW